MFVLGSTALFQLKNKDGDSPEKHYLGKIDSETIEVDTGRLEMDIVENELPIMSLVADPHYQLNLPK